ncbi:MAG: sensor domain-containing diguanylate cyclase [Synechococcales cyanobacterium C42_A2020_086]|jgi:diguanylate cyclase (GGDEF)-like protein|nr:sensor domain-containing diguanylate cyclase [Synechococcales cyanobacterium C42_A2020_086]
MKSGWQHFYSDIKTAVLNLDTLDSLLQQAVAQITTLYGAECLLWAGFELGVADALRVYTTPQTADRYANTFGFLTAPTPLAADTEAGVASLATSVYPYRIRSLPLWLLDQQHCPHLTQLDTGDLIIPVTQRGSAFASDQDALAPTGALQFVLQLDRSRRDRSLSPPASDSPSSAVAVGPIGDWSSEELLSLEIISSQLGLAHSALYWRQRLEQARQQAALVGRISRLLNSTLNPDELVGCIVAELGCSLNCDRSILVNLCHDPVSILAVWDHPAQELPPLEQRQTSQAYWHSTIDLFLQGGACYLQIKQRDSVPDPLQVWLKDIGAESVLLVPMFIQDEFFGAVALLSYQQERAYLIDELQTVRQVADQAAIALTNAQNYQQLWHKQQMLRMQNDSLQEAILRDDLTQLMNRRSLERELENLSMTAIWTIRPVFSVIVCDIDYFKHVNDVYGHLVGDQVLQGVAQRLQGQLRRGTPAYRYGGEEFVIILTDTPLHLALDVAERLRRAIRASPIPTKVADIDITASFGVAQQNPSNDRCAWDVLQRADKALYEAKRQGRDRVQALESSG